jgi:hypothetical protein
VPHIHLLSGTLVLHSLPPTISRPPSCAHVWRVTCLRLWLLGADECCMLGEGGLFTIARVGCMVATQKGVQIQVNRGRSTPKMARPARSCAHVPERSITNNARPILSEFFERLRSTEGFTLLHISRSTELCFGGMNRKSQGCQKCCMPRRKWLTEVIGDNLILGDYQNST